MTTNEGALLLVGPDAANPLGFLCALGALRVSTLIWSDRKITLAWKPHATGWRPVLQSSAALDADDLIRGLYEFCRYGRRTGAQQSDEAASEVAEAFPYLAIEKNTAKIEPEDFARHGREQREASGIEPREFLAFLAAFGSDAVVEEDHIADTALRTMSGSGHQHFLKTMLDLAEALEPRHLEQALFSPWRYTDPLARLSMRWDPHDLKQYALQAGDPSDDPSRGKRGSVLGANRLAIEALPLFSTMPVLRGLTPKLATTGFEVGPSQPYWTWPIWRSPLTLDVVSSLLAHRSLQKVAGDDAVAAAAREELGRMGVAEIFRSRRISVGYFRNFTPAQAI